MSAVNNSIYADARDEEFHALIQNVRQGYNLETHRVNTVSEACALITEISEQGKNSLLYLEFVDTSQCSWVWHRKAASSAGSSPSEKTEKTFNGVIISGF